MGTDMYKLIFCLSAVAALPLEENVEAGGLADKQAPGPVAVAPAVMKVETPVVYSHLPYLVPPATHLTYNTLHPLTYTGLHHLNYAATYPYTYPLQYIAPVKAEAA